MAYLMGKGEIVDLVEPTADNKIQTETWLLAEMVVVFITYLSMSLWGLLTW